MRHVAKLKVLVLPACTVAQLMPLIVFHGDPIAARVGRKLRSGMTVLSFNRAHDLQRRLVMDATRISDGKYVMLKRLPAREGPYELQINKMFSEEPLVSDPRNHCARLLDVIELPNDSPIMVHALLRPFYKPRFQMHGGFVAFFEQISEVGITVRRPKVDHIAQSY